MGRSLAFVLVVAGIASLAGGLGRAQPAPPEEEIEMEPEPATGSDTGSAKKAVAPAPTKDPAKDATAQPPDPQADAVPAPVPVKDPKLARKWLYAGMQLVQKGDYWTRNKRPDDAKQQYENAVTAFGKSIEAGEDLNTYFLLAEAEDKLGRHDLAAAHCRVVLKAQSGVRPDVMKKATARFDDLSAKIGIVALTVLPEGTTITLAGSELGKAPLAEPLYLMPGSYTFAFAADGFQPKETEIKVEAGSESERTIELEAVTIVVEPPKAPEVEPVETPVAASEPTKLPLYIGAGATGALFLTATITGILAIGQHGTYTGTDSTANERASAKTSGERLALISDLTLLGTLGAAGFTAYWYFYKYKRAQRKPATEQRVAPTKAPEMVRTRGGESQWSSKVQMMPWVQPEAGGLTIVGSF